MKTTEHTSTAHSLQFQQGNQPFFQKEGDVSFFSEGSKSSRFFGGSSGGDNPPPFFSPSTIQPKLTIGAPGDKYEQEADEMADQVMQKLASGKNESSLQRKCAECRTCVAGQIQPMRIHRMEGEEDPELQAKGNVPGLQASADLESRLGSTKGSGSPLPEDTRSSMESSFGADFSGVRVHTNDSAVQMNQELGAQAFTHGSDVYFNSGEYDTGSTEGQHLLAHELTHVVQQNKSIHMKRPLYDWNEKPWGGEYANVKVSPIPNLIGEKANYTTKISRWASALEGYGHYDSTLYEYIARLIPFKKAKEYTGWQGDETTIDAKKLQNAHWGSGATYRHALGASSSWFSDIEAYADFNVLPLIISAEVIDTKTVPDYLNMIPIQSSGGVAIEFRASTSDVLHQGFSVSKSKGQENYLSGEITSNIGVDVGVVAAKIESSVEAKETISNTLEKQVDFQKAISKGTSMVIKVPATKGPVNKVAIPNYQIVTLKLLTRKSDLSGVDLSQTEINYVHAIHPTGTYDLIDAIGKENVEPGQTATQTGKEAYKDQKAKESTPFRPINPNSVIHSIQMISKREGVRNYVDQTRTTIDGPGKLTTNASQSVEVKNGIMVTASSSVSNELNASIKSQIGLGDAVTKSTGISAGVGGKISSGEKITSSIMESINTSRSEHFTLADSHTLNVPANKRGSLYLTPLVNVTSYKILLINGKTIYVHAYTHQPVRHSHSHFTQKSEGKLHPDNWKDVLSMSPEEFQADKSAQQELFDIAKQFRDKQQAFAEKMLGANKIKGKVKSLLKRDDLKGFVEGIVKKCKRNGYKKIGQMDDIVRGRFDLQAEKDVNIISTELINQKDFPIKEIDGVVAPRRKQPGGGFGYPRWHVIVTDPATGLTHEWQIGTEAVTQVYETAGINVPEEMKEDVSKGLIKNDIHDIDFDIFRQGVEKKYPDLHRRLGIPAFQNDVDKVSAEAGLKGNKTPDLKEKIEKLHQQAAGLLKKVVDAIGIAEVRKFYH